MSESREVTYKCPYCGEEFTIEVWDSVNAQEDPDLRERCISGDLFRFTCPHCHKEFMVQFPLVYIDRDHKFVLWLSQNEAPESLRTVTKPLADKGYRLRRTPTLEEFCEKIQIFEDGADDRMVELAKYDSFIEVIDNRKAKPEEVTSVEYQKTQDEVMKINIRMGDKGMSFLIPLGGMQEEMDQNRQLYHVDNSTFPVVNSDWIISLFHEPSGKA